MKKLALAALLAFAAAPLAACQSHNCETQIRFWSVNNGAAFTVDTPGAPLGERTNAEFVNARGQRVKVADASLSAISEAQYTAATSGAGYSLAYCPVMKTCWAMPTEK